MVSRLKHGNLVELLGYCVEGNLRVLAYEFATMGSLHDILHGMQSQLVLLYNFNIDLTQINIRNIVESETFM